MTIADKKVLVTGANRGIGQALVEEALKRGVKRVYAGTRQPLAHPDGRVTPLILDVTSAPQTQAAAEGVGSLDILINNAGLAFYDDLSDRAALEQHLAVNLYGPYGVIQAFLPLLTRSRGAIVNVLSDAALAALPIIPAYSISKAAAFSLTQSLRALLAGRGVRIRSMKNGFDNSERARVDAPTEHRCRDRQHVSGSRRRYRHLRVGARRAGTRGREGIWDLMKSHDHDLRVAAGLRCAVREARDWPGGLTALAELADG
jgi:NAD(P)-dependent dehydrogenase (short-subunit alcohol dehydrogenase family)